MKGSPSPRAKIDTSSPARKKAQPRTEENTVCGSRGCRCKADPPQKHGPYYQLSFTRKGKSRTQFVRRHDLSLVEEQVRNYLRLKNLTDRWVALGMAFVAPAATRAARSERSFRAKFRGENADFQEKALVIVGL